MIGAVLLTIVLSAAVPPVVDRSYCHVGKWDRAPLNVPLDGGAAAPTVGTVSGKASAAFLFLALALVKQCGTPTWLAPACW